MSSLPPERRTDPITLMRSEMRLRYGAVGNAIGEFRLEANSWKLLGDEFLIRLDGFSLRYRKGEGVTAELHEGARQSELALYLNGSVYAAAACINGLYPLHASAVAWNGGVHAFTGPSGAGKSTLVTALGNRGFPMFCDDTLILDLSDPAVPLALPGHKRLKLTAQAIALTGAQAQEQVDDGIEKFYALPPGGDWGEPLPLRQLIFLEEGEDVSCQAVTGGRKIARLTDDHYTFDFYTSANPSHAASRFALQARLASQIAMTRLARPRDTSHFDESVALAAQLVWDHESAS